MISWGAGRTPGVIEFVQPRLPAASQKLVMAVPIGDAVVLTPQRIKPVLFVQTAPPTVAAAPAQTALRPAPVVFVPVEVRDPMDRYVTGLDRDVFRVEEDGVAQTITSISSAGEGTDVVVIADPQVERVPNGMNLNPANSVVVTFDVSLKSVLGADRMIDRDADIRKAIVILATKGASWQSYTEAEVRTVADGLNMPVYVVEVSDSAGPDQTMLGELALRTGGRYIAVSRPEDVMEAYRGVLTALRNLYFVGYVSSNAGRDGGYRSLNVGVEAPRGLPKLTVRSRVGYLAAAR